AALEDRASRAGGHARAEAVLALPAPYVGLVGPLHGWLLTSRGLLNTKTAGPGPRAASIDERWMTGPGARRRFRFRSRRQVLHRPNVEIGGGERASREGVFAGR